MAKGIFAHVVLAAAFAGAEPAVADPPPSTSNSAELDVGLDQLLEQLDSDRFSVREHATAQIEQLLRQPGTDQLLAAKFRRVQRETHVSFEVRARLKRWLRHLPVETVTPAVPEANLDELERVISHLDDDSYAIRIGAVKRLQWLLSNPKHAYPIVVRLKAFRNDPATPWHVVQRLEPVWRQARVAWLTSDPTTWDLAAVDDAQIDHWIDLLLKPELLPIEGSRWLSHEMAAEQLHDLLANDADVPRIKQRLEARLPSALGTAGESRLRKLIDLTRPAMVAEYWQERRHLGEQHLLVDVPCQGPGAYRPSHFDRIDDQWAHCVSGNTLNSDEDYPVHVAFAHPFQEDAFFHLINLPNPRRRMAYDDYVKLDETKRLADISRRTLDRYLHEKTKLDEDQLVLLDQLDDREVSRFAGQYFFLVDDEELPSSGRQRVGGRPSRFGMICAQLAQTGTREAIPGLLKAIEQQRFLPPEVMAEYRLPWLAALSIARRNPWESVDAWLAEILERRDLLIDGEEDGPELGATAAALLLRRRGKDPATYQLEAVSDYLFRQIHVEGYRYANTGAVQRVHRWWKTELARESSGNKGQHYLTSQRPTPQEPATTLR